MDIQTIAAYNKQAEAYDAETADFWSAFPTPILDAFSSRIPHGAPVLSIGSGSGRDALLLRERGLTVTCLDASQEMVRICAAKGFAADEGDLLALPYADTSFAGVWAYTSLLHVKKSDMPTALFEARRVLTSNGTFMLGMIEGTEAHYRTSSGMSEERWFTFYMQQELEQMLAECGFAVSYFESFKPRSKTYLNIICEKTDQTRSL